MSKILEWQLDQDLAGVKGSAAIHDFMDEINGLINHEMYRAYYGRYEYLEDVPDVLQFSGELV